MLILPSDNYISHDGGGNNNNKKQIIKKTTYHTGKWYVGMAWETTQGDAD